MSIALIPESAPFNAEQRAWLNGFFAGLLNMTEESSGAAAALATGMATAPGNSPSAEEEEDLPWHDPSLPLAERLELAAEKPLAGRLMAAMAQLDCGACSYVCQSYAAAIATGEERDLTRCAPGGKETAQALKQLVALEPATPAAPRVAAAPTNHRASAQASAAAPAYTRARPLVATLRESVRLTHPDAAKDTRHVVIDLGNSGLTYRPGDALGILPENAGELVEGILQALGASGDEPAPTPEGGQKPLREALRGEYNLTQPRPALLELLAARASVADEARQASAALAADVDEFLAPLDVLDLLNRFPSARPAIAEMLAALGKLQPRLYSISSALEQHPREVHLTVGVVRYEAHGKWFHGVASNFLGVRTQPGDPVRVFVQPSHRFQLPSDPAAPIIMVGPGTGIAPFRAFLQYRAATAAPGRNWLVFGNQFRNFDYLYADELEAWRVGGLLTRLDLAFSRDTSQKIYVQDRLREQGAELWRWLEEGAYFYVCGDAKRMAPDVDQALRDVAVAHGSLSPAGAKDWTRQLAKEKRYLKDVY